MTWAGATGLDVAIVGGSVDLPNNSSSLFVCAASVAAGSLTVPAAVLANLLPGRGSARDSKAVVFVVASSPPSLFSGAGLDSGFLMPTYVLGKAVTVR